MAQVAIRCPLPATPRSVPSRAAAAVQPLTGAPLLHGPCCFGRTCKKRTTLVHAAKSLWLQDCIQHPGNMRQSTSRNMARISLTEAQAYSRTGYH